MGHSTIHGILYSNFIKVFCTFPHYPQKKCKNNKYVFLYYFLGIMVIFLKIMKNYTNFYIFSSVYIVNWNFKLDFLGSARRCMQANFFGYTTVHLKLKSEGLVSIAKSKNTGAWKGRLKRFFVDPFVVELATNGTNIIWRYSKNKQFLFYAQGRGSKIEPATPL